MPKWLAKKISIIPGKKTYPSDPNTERKCPHCGAAISTLVPKKDTDDDKVKMVCPACGNEP